MVLFAVSSGSGFVHHMYLFIYLFTYLFIYVVFNDTVNNSVYITSNCMMCRQ
jgi:hypothetical protein